LLAVAGDWDTAGLLLVPVAAGAAVCPHTTPQSNRLANSLDRIIMFHIVEQAGNPEVLHLDVRPVQVV
jgi:hypothetical protein